MVIVVAILGLALGAASLTLIQPVTGSGSTSSDTSGGGPIGFRYHQPIELDNPTNTTQNVAANVTIDTAKLIDEGKLRSDCSDIRFTLSDGETELDHWIAHGCNTNSTTFWVRLYSFPTGTETIDMFYGASSQKQTDLFNPPEASLRVAVADYVDIPNTTDQDVGVVYTYPGVASDSPNPVVILYGATRNGTQPYSPRVRNNVGGTFEAFIEEPDDQGHVKETVGILALPPGQYHTFGFDNITVGRIDTASVHHDDESYDGEEISLNESRFPTRPAVFGTLNTYNNGEFMETHIGSVTRDGFTVEQEAAETGNPAEEETIGWMALSQASERAWKFGVTPKDGDDDGQHQSAELLDWEDFEPQGLGFDPVLVVQGISNSGKDGYWALSEGTWKEDYAKTYAQEDLLDGEANHRDTAFAWATFREDTPPPYLIPVVNEDYDEVSVNLGPVTNLSDSIDSDGDGFPDDVEETLCSRSTSHDLINNETGSHSGTCESNTNYTAPPSEAHLEVPSFLDSGPDIDNDGLPANVTIEASHVVANATSSAERTLENAGERVTVEIDGNDTNPSVPVSDFNQFCSPVDAVQDPSAITKGPDSDNDGLPAYAAIVRGEICFDKREPETPILNPGTKSYNRTVDSDDSDPTVPVEDTVTLEGIPVWANFTKDRDDDHMPCTSNLRRVDLTFDASEPGNITRTYRTNTRSFDPDCSTQDNALDDPLDSDGDDIPDSLESDLCDSQQADTTLDGTCNSLGTDYSPTLWYLNVLDDL